MHVLPAGLEEHVGSRIRLWARRPQWRAMCTRTSVPRLHPRPISLLAQHKQGSLYFLLHVHTLQTRYNAVLGVQWPVRVIVRSALYRNEAGSHSIAREGVFCFMYMHGTCPSILMQLVERREISTGKSWLVNVLLLQLHHDHLVTTFELSHILTNTLNNVFLLSIWY